MSLPAEKLETPVIPAPYLSVGQAAILLEMSERHLRRLCEEQWSKQGYATKHHGQWIVHPQADKRLKDESRMRREDLEELASLRSGRVRPQDIAVAERRLKILRVFDDFEMTRPLRREGWSQFVNHLRTVELFPAPGVDTINLSSLYTWRQDYRRYGVCALVPQVTKRGRKPAVIGEKAWAYFEGLYLGGNGIRVTKAHKITVGEISLHHAGEAGWEWPAYSTIEKLVRKRIPNRLRTMADKGPRQYEAMHVPKGERDFEAIPAGAEYCGDERKLDVWCRYRDGAGRWRATRQIWYTCWIDIGSRMIVGSRLALFANSSTILGSLKSAIRMHGVPKIVRVDWGRDYRKATGHIHTKRSGNIAGWDGEHVGSIMDRLSISVEPVRVYSPQSKPIESMFSGMKNDFDRLFASFWGGCPSERHEDRDRYVRENMEKLPTVEDIERAITKREEIYNSTPHTGRDMFDKSPMQAMDVFRVEPARKESDEVLNFIFMELLGPKRVRRDGVRILNHWFGRESMKLADYQGKKVYLAVQPDNLATAMVCDLAGLPLFEVECDALRGIGKRDAERLAKLRCRMRRADYERVRVARKVLLAQSPMQLLEKMAAGGEAMHGTPRVEVKYEPTIRVRPELEEAISKATRRGGKSDSKSIRASNAQDAEPAVELGDLLNDDDVENGGSWYHRPVQEEEEATVYNFDPD